MKRTSLLLFLGLTLQAPLATAQQQDVETITRGEYLSLIMDCAGCHMPRGPDGIPMVEAGLSGGTVGFEIPGMGTFWPPNLTPAESALGSWTDDQIVDAIRTGVRPDGRVLAPVMPWPNYSALTDEDAYALVAYLRTLNAVESAVIGPLAPGEPAAAPFYRVTLP